MKAVILVVFVLTVAAVLCLLEAYREQQYFKVTEDVVVSHRLNGLKKEKKIVFLSDLHNKEYGVGNERLLDAICKARPAGICWSGRKGVPLLRLWNLFRNFLRSLRCIMPAGITSSG